MRVYIPSPLRSYTSQRSQVDASGEGIADLFLDLDRQFPGMRFRIINEQDRIREHIKLFVNLDQVFDLKAPLRTSDEVHIICALSGG